jgi:multiple sugar transport system ATP-binding protein
VAEVTFESVSKHFGEVKAVDELSLSAGDDDFVVLLGPSGCGKSTALRMIAGLETPTSGTIAHRWRGRQPRRSEGS